MKKVLYASFLAIMMVAMSAHATVFGDTTNNNQTYNQGGQGGAANAGAIAGAAAVNSNDIKVSVNPNIDASTRSNATASVFGSGNSSASGGKAESTSTGGSVGDITVDNGQKYRPTAASAIGYSAPPSAPCMGSSGGGVQGVVGFSFSTTWTSDECNDRENFRFASEYGDKEVAIEMMRAKMPGYAEAEQRIADRKAGK